MKFIGNGYAALMAPAVRSAKEDELEDTISAIKSWDKHDAKELLELLREMGDLCDALGMDMEHLIDITSLPSVDFPENCSTVHIWALDLQGQAIVGASFRHDGSVMPLSECSWAWPS